MSIFHYMQIDVVTLDGFADISVKFQNYEVKIVYLSNVECVDI